MNAIEKGWLQAWLKTNFKGKKNADLWRRFWSAYQRHRVSFHWIKGHAGNLENERCDQLAVQSAKKSATSVDHGYEEVC